MKKIIILSLSLVVLAAWGIRVYNVNANAEKPQIEVYKKGTVVDIGENYIENDSELVNGYTVQILSSELVNADEYLAEIGMNKEELSFGDDTLGFYIVKVKIENVSNDFVNEGGINFLFWDLQGDRYRLTLDDEVFKFLNPATNGSTGFSLNKGKPMEFTVPYDILAPHKISFSELKKSPPKMLISSYPIRKKLEIV
jgi:hypothetical protein